MAGQLRFDFDGTAVEFKVCKKCGREKPLAEYRQHAPGKYHGQCKQCLYAANKLYREAHAEQIRESQKLREAKNVDKVREKRKAYVRANEERIKRYRRDRWEKSKDAINKQRQQKRASKPVKPRQTSEEKKQRSCRYREAHKEHLREINRRWRMENQERILRNRKEYAAKNKEMIRQKDQERRKREAGRRKAYNQHYYAIHGARLRAANIPRSRAWNRANKDKRSEALHRRKARLAGNGGMYSVRDLRRLWDRFHGLCAYCGKHKATTIEHVIPISRGGTNFIGNILPACGDCNYSKNNRTLMEWRMYLRRRGRILEGVISEPIRNVPPDADQGPKPTPVRRGPSAVKSSISVP